MVASPQRGRGSDGEAAAEAAATSLPFERRRRSGAHSSIKSVLFSPLTHLFTSTLSPQRVFVAWKMDKGRRPAVISSCPSSASHSTCTSSSSLCNSSSGTLVPRGGVGRRRRREFDFTNKSKSGGEGRGRGNRLRRGGSPSSCLHSPLSRVAVSHIRALQHCGIPTYVVPFPPRGKLFRKERSVRACVFRRLR